MPNDHAGAAPGLMQAAGGLAGATPWGAIAQGVTGLAQTIGGWIQQHRATKKLESLQSPAYQQNKSILDYYNNALQRYNVNPYQSQQYRVATQGANRNIAYGLNALKGRGSSVAGVNKLVGIGNDAALKAGVAAEQEQNQRFGALGGATQLKAGEDRMAFDINKQQPFERKYNLLAMKAGGGNQIMNAGLQNTFGAGTSLSERDMVNKMYGRY